MEIKLDDLQNGLNLVFPAVARRSTLPVLSHVLMDVGEYRMTLAANNLEMAIKTSIPVEAHDTNPSVTVPARLLMDYVKTLEGETVDIIINAEKAELTLKALHSEGTIKGFGGDEFPSLPEPKGTVITLSQGALEFLVHRALIAVSDDANREILTGVFTELDGHDVRMVAADGFRLSRVEYVQDWEGEKQTSLIPANVFHALDKLCRAYPVSAVQVTVDESRIFFEVGDAVLITQLIEGNYPQYDAIIPKTHTVHVTIEDVKPFLQAVKTLGLFSMILKLSIADNKIVMTAVGEESGEGTAEVDVVADGNIDIGLSAKYLKDMLTVMSGGGPIEMLMTTPTSPVLFKQGERFIHVVMPLSIL